MATQRKARPVLDIIANKETYAFFGTSALSPIVIRHCNGTKSVAFGKAWFDYIIPSKYGIPFAFLFKDGTYCFLDMIRELEKGGGDKYSPRVALTDDKKKAAIASLKKYLTEDFEKHEQCLLSLEDCDSEMKVQAVLAVHLFAPLLPDIPGAKKYGIDKHHFPKDEQQRKCPTCGEKLMFTDTSFGNSRVWHGYADIILQKCAVIINIENDETRSTRERGEYDESDSEESVSSFTTTSSFSFVEVKCKKKAGDIRMQEEAEAQALAQTITNAFCEERGNRDKFIPSFLATNEKVKIYMYCCDKDVLLQSEYSPILEDGTISIQTLVLVWLAVNFDYFPITDVFGEKFKEKVKYKWPVSNFRKVVGEAAVEIYENQSSRPLINDRSQKRQETKICFHPEFYRISTEEKDIFDLNEVMTIIGVIGKE